MQDARQMALITALGDLNHGFAIFAKRKYQRQMGRRELARRDVARCEEEAKIKLRTLDLGPWT
jgi:hypothetical protein